MQSQATPKSEQQHFQDSLFLLATSLFLAGISVSVPQVAILSWVGDNAVLFECIAKNLL